MANTDLYTASFYGRLDEVKDLLAKGADPNNSYAGFSALYTAAEHGHIEVVKLLVESGADINRPRRDIGSGPLSACIENSHFHIATYLVDNGADVNQHRTDGTGITSIFTASQTGQLKFVKLLYENGANINAARHDDGAHPLYVCAENGHVDTLNYLISNGGEVNHCRNDGISPFFVAAENGQLDTLKILQQHGADINKNRPDTGASPLSIATEMGHTDVVQFCIDNKADINEHRDGTGNPLWEFSGETPMAIAARRGYSEIAKSLIRAGADVNKCVTKESPLIIAMKCNEEESFSSMIREAGANTTLKDEHEISTAVVAAMYGHVGIWEEVLGNPLTRKPKESAKAEVPAKDDKPKHHPYKNVEDPNAATHNTDTNAHAAQPLTFTNPYTNAPAPTNPAPANPYTNAPVAAPINPYTNAPAPTNPYTNDPAPTNPYTNAPGAAFNPYTNAPGTATPQDTAAPVSRAEGSYGEILSKYNIELSKKLGSGAFGDVYRGLQGDAVVAVKFLQKASQTALKEVLEELSLLGALKHPNVIKHTQFIKEIPAIVMEIAACGSLQDFISKQTEPLDWALRMKWANQLSNTLVHLHSRNIVHRDLRCVNVLLTDTLDVKLSDFGVSMWTNNEGQKVLKPYYKGGKGIYEVADEASYEPHFDVRLLGIVLTKMLLHGPEVEKDLYDWKTEGLTEEIKSDKKSYNELIKLCLKEKGKTAKDKSSAGCVAALIRSMIIYETLGTTAEQMSRLKNKLTEGSFRRKNRTVNVDNQVHLVLSKKPNRNALRVAIADLSLFTPDELVQKFSYVMNEVGIIDQSEEEEERETVEVLINKITKCEAQTLGQMVEIIHKLHNREMDNPKVVTCLLEQVHDTPYWQQLEAASMELRGRPVTDEGYKKFAALLKEETHYRCKREVLITLGELGNSEEFIVTAVTNMLENDKEPGVRRRAAVALVKLLKDKMTRDLREKCALTLCHDAEKETRVEKVQIAIGLRTIGIMGHEVSATLLHFLSDESDAVKIEAGKTLTELTSMEEE